MTDLFEEVEEQLRSDRYNTLARKAVPWAIAIAAAALVAALAYWGWDTWRNRAISEASTQYNTAAEAFAKGDIPAARKQWIEVSGSSAAGYKSLALMQLGGLQVQENKTAEAVKLFDQAADAAPNEFIADAARLKSAFALLDTAPYSDLEARLTPLTQDGRPYRLHAREALGFAKLMAGNTAGARGDFLVLSTSLGAPAGLKGRAQAAVILIDSGAAKAVPGVVKQALTLPPPPPNVGPSQASGAPLAPPAPQSQATGPQ